MIHILYNMISTEYKNIMTSVLASVITIIIMIKYLEKSVDYWIIGNIIVLAAVIVAETSLDYNKKMLILVLSVTWIGATIIEQLASVAKNKTNCSSWTDDTLNGNLLIKWDKNTELDDTELGRLLYVSLYLFTVVMLMIILLSKMDSEAPILGFLNDDLKYLFVIMLPITVVFINESNLTSSIYESGANKDDGKYLTSDILFKRLVTGNFKYDTNGKENNQYIIRFITMILFLAGLFILFMNYSTGGSIAMFTDTLGVGSSNIPVYIMLFILMFFNFVIESLFLQSCSFNESTKNDETQENQKEFKCRIAKYGGIVGLLYISYVVAVLYQINGTRDKLFALLFIIALTFGFGELFISMKAGK